MMTSKQAQQLRLYNMTLHSAHVVTSLVLKNNNSVRHYAEQLSITELNAVMRRYKIVEEVLRKKQAAADKHQAIQKYKRQVLLELKEHNLNVNDLIPLLRALSS